MDLSFSAEDEQFREECRAFLLEHLTGDFEQIRFRGGPGDEESFVEERLQWEQLMGREGWNCIGWSPEHGGRGASLMQQVIWNEEYARLGGPGRVGHIGETLAGPTIIAFGTEAQKRRFLPGIVAATELWCQGYSEPNAGSDLANVQTRAELKDGKWSITGQKTWTSGGHHAHWSFVLCRTDASLAKHKGLSYILVPMQQEGVSVQPIEQLTGDSEFNEVFFDDALTDEDNVVGGVNNGWRVAMGTLAFERGASTLGQQLAFLSELDAIIEAAKDNGRINDPLIRARLVDAKMGVEIMRYNALRMLSRSEGADLSPEALVSKLYWSNWHRDLGELAMTVLGPEAEIAEAAPYVLNGLQKMYLFSRADTIYAGSNEIQRNIIAERGLGLPRGPRA